MELKMVAKSSRKLFRKGYFGPPRIFFLHRDESIGENVIFRRSRPVAEYQKLLPEILKSVHLDPETLCTWSQTAGCSCGCTPGFIMTAKGRWDIVAVVEGEHSSIDPNALQVAGDRAAKILRYFADMVGIDPSSLEEPPQTIH